MKINVYPCKPQFYCINVGFKGVKTIQACFHDGRNLVKVRIEQNYKMVYKDFIVRLYISHTLKRNHHQILYK